MDGKRENFQSAFEIYFSEILIEDGNGENYDILAGDETCEFDDENKKQLPGIMIQEVNLNNLNNTQSSQAPEKQDSGIEGSFSPLINPPKLLPRQGQHPELSNNACSASSEQA